MDNRPERKQRLLAGIRGAQIIVVSLQGYSIYRGEVTWLSFIAFLFALGILAFLDHDTSKELKELEAKAKQPEAKVSPPPAPQPPRVGMSPAEIQRQIDKVMDQKNRRFTR